MRSTNSKTGEPLLPLPSRPGWIPAPRSSTRIISPSSANPSPPIRSHRRRNYSSRVQVSKNGYEPQYWASLRRGTMQATENRELLEVLLHEARKPAWPRLQVSVDVCMWGFAQVVAPHRDTYFFAWHILTQPARKCDSAQWQ